MTRRVILTVALGCAFADPVRAQAPGPSPQPSAVTHTAYSKNTELFAEWRPLIVGQATRLTAHLTRIYERFKAYVDVEMTLTLAIGSLTANAATKG